MLYTSYFAMMRNFPQEGVLPISISRFPPKWYTGACVKNLAPPEDLLKNYKEGFSDAQDYDRRYAEAVLNHHVTESWIKKGTEGLLPDTLDGKPVWESETDHAVFLCFEKPGDFCHRHLLSEHLRMIGVPCREATKEDFEQWKLKRDLCKEVMEAERE